MPATPAPPYGALLFDLDGTLLDTLEDLALACDRVLAARGRPPFPLDAYRRFVGRGASHLVACLLPEEERRDPAALQAMLAAFQREYAQCWREHSRPYPGIPELLDGLTARGLRMAVLSNKPHAFTELCVRELLSAWSFAPVLGQREGVPRKPDPAGALEAARVLGLPPERVLYVGDSDVDMRTARNAGMFAAGVLWGFRGADELRDAGAQALIARPEELLALVDHPAGIPNPAP